MVCFHHHIFGVLEPSLCILASDARQDIRKHIEADPEVEVEYPGSKLEAEILLEQEGDRQDEGQSGQRHGIQEQRQEQVSIKPAAQEPDRISNLL